MPPSFRLFALSEPEVEKRSEALVDEADNERPRHVQQIGGLLRRDLGFVSDDDLGLAVGDVAHQGTDERRRRRRNVQRCYLAASIHEKYLGEAGDEERRVVGNSKEVNPRAFGPDATAFWKQ